MSTERAILKVFIRQAKAQVTPVASHQQPSMAYALPAEGLIVMSVTVFGVPVKGSMPTLLLTAVMYCIISTGMGLLFSSVTRSQIAVIFLTMLGTLLPSVQMCGLTNPVDAQEGAARFIGSIFPTSHMLTINRGIFSKALEFRDLHQPILALLIMIPVILGLGIMFQKKQES